MIKKPTIDELKYFVTAVANLHHVKTKEISPQLVRSSLSLLKDLPAAREAVFEYFVIVFDTSVENYIKQCDIQNLNIIDDDSISDIQNVLENLILHGPKSWPPLISTWCLRLLGKLSSKHSPKPDMNILAASNLWLGSNTIRCLLGLTALCFGKLNENEIEQCIGIMLNIFKQHLPNFDWVVSRLGSCFPQQVISRIFNCGLKEFALNRNCNLDSEIAILAHLSLSHENDLKISIKEILQNFMNTKSRDTLNTNLIPYLLHLCRRSDILLQSVVSVFLEIYDENSLSSFNYQNNWIPQSINIRELLILTELALNIQKNGTNILLKWSTLASKYLWCNELIEYIFNELEKSYLQGRTTPLLQDIFKSESKELLWTACGSNNPIEQSTAIRLILLGSSKLNPLFYHQTICELLMKPSNGDFQSLGALIRILGRPNGSVDFAEITPGIELALDTFFLCNNNLGKENSINGMNILRNLIYIIRIENKNSCPNLKKKPITKALQQCFPKLLNIFKMLMNKVIFNVKSLDKTEKNIEIKENNDKYKQIKLEALEEGEEIDSYPIEEIIYDNMSEVIANEANLLVKLLTNLDFIGNENFTFSVCDSFRLSKLLIKYFFWSLTEINPIKRTNAINNLIPLLERHCKNKIGQAVAMHSMLYGILYQYSPIFISEVKSEDKFEKSLGYKSIKSDMNLLITLNQKLGSSTITNRSVLHAGIIGQGLRETKPETLLPSKDIQKLLLLGITTCCKDDTYNNVIQNFSTISTNLVQLISPDVMYNSVHWYDEEFSKVTMERDLHIRRVFKNLPILWPIMEHIAVNRPALCNASSLFRAICASVLHQWQAKSVEKTINLKNSDLMNVTKKMIKVMSLGQLLPPPFSYFHFIIDYFDPTEIAIVLKECIWVFMKENVPIPMAFSKEPITGFQFRDFVKLRPYIKDDILRNMMERKLSQLGHFYYVMFVLPDEYDVGVINLDDSKMDTSMNVTM